MTINKTVTVRIMSENTSTRLEVVDTNVNGKERVLMTARPDESGQFVFSSHPFRVTIKVEEIAGKR